jgi:hypothetical protein
MKTMKTILTVAALAASVAVQADTATSTAASQSVAPSIKEKLSLSLWSNFAGPAVNNVNSQTPSSDLSTEPVNFDNIITGGYKLNPNLEVGAAVEAVYRPVMSQDLMMKDAWARVQASKIIDSNGFGLSVDLRAYTPSPNRENLVTGFRSTQNLTWTTGDLTLGSYTFVRANMYSTAPGNAELRRIYFAPNGTYAFTKTLQATLWVDLVSLRYRAGVNEAYLGKNDPIDIEPGINWDITDSVSFNPYVNFYTDNLAWDNTYVGFILTAKAF